MTALGVQVAALTWMLTAVGKRRWTNLGPLLVVAGVIFHGFTEIVQILTPDRYFEQCADGFSCFWYRSLVRQSDVDAWAFTVSVALLVFTASYVTLRGKDRGGKQSGLEAPTKPKFPDWRLLALLTSPLYLYRLTIPVHHVPEGHEYWINGLTEQFVVLGVAATGLSYLIGNGAKRFWLVVTVQSILVAFLGQRLEVIAAAVMMIAALQRVGFQLRGKHVAMTAATVAFAVVAISSARFAPGVGRESFQQLPAARVRALGSGVGALATSPDLSVANDFIYRFDGNSFGGLMHMRLSEGYAGSRGQSLLNNVNLAIPRFMNPRKDAQLSKDPEEKQFLIERFHLPEQFDYLPTLFGALYSYWWAGGLVIMATVLGGSFALADRWLERRATISAAILGMALTYCVVFYERSTEVYLLSLRGPLLLVCALASGKFIYRTARAIAHGRWRAREPKPEGLRYEDDPVDGAQDEEHLPSRPSQHL